MSKVGRMVKESIVEELSTELAARRNLFVTSLGKLPATDADALRLKLSTSQARVVFVKRRLGRRAIEALKSPGLTELLEGSVGLILPGEDVLPTAKLLMEFVKAHEEQVTVRGAVIDGQVLDRARVTELANLPNRPTLLAQVVGTLESPMADVIFTIERLIGDIAWLAEQVASAKPDPKLAPAADAPEAPPTAPASEGPPTA